MFEDIFLHKKPVHDKLIKYGFCFKDGKYTFTTEIIDGSFILEVTLNGQATPETQLTEKETGEQYTLYKTFAQGSFVGMVRTAVAEVLQDISDKCCDTAIFKQEQTLRVINFIKAEYGDSLEFLWEKFPDTAIWRRKDTSKWYGIAANIPKSKLGIDSKDNAEIIDLRSSPDKIESLLAEDGFYPGWHMNKKSWYTIILDGSIPDERLFELIRESYRLATK
ncbi:MAG: MmcQ/YjbR family DNA-binding protein [Clostridia bacterium]|nr:MmcQ/YjbR family DNA-binding protein [Clostridia bacterium]